MLETIIIILIIAWALGFIGGVTFGGAIHILLIIVLILIVIRLIQGRPVV